MDELRRTAVHQYNYRYRCDDWELSNHLIQRLRTDGFEAKHGSYTDSDGKFHYGGGSDVLISWGTVEERCDAFRHAQLQCRDERDTEVKNNSKFNRIVGILFDK